MRKELICLHCFYVKYARLKPLPPGKYIRKRNAAPFDGTFMGNEFLLIAFLQSDGGIRVHHPMPSSFFHRAKIVGTTVV